MGTCVGGARGARCPEFDRKGKHRPYPARLWHFCKKLFERSRNYRSSDLRRLPRRLPLTSSERREAALKASVDDLLKASALRASENRKMAEPKLSAATLPIGARLIPAAICALALFGMSNSYISSALCLLAVLPGAFRLLFAVWHSSSTARSVVSEREIPDHELPLYSIILPLRREARMVDQLLSAIEDLDYPAEKLDVIVAVEADEPHTRAAIDRRRHRVSITVIPVPPVGPRTKPKALNVALEFARGALTVIYDAEDRPEPNQLRRAVKAFRAGGSDLACVQARLCIDNRTSWLTRLFTAEYAGQFDIFLPALSARGLPFPLGGSSNHFRTDILREVGGWDAYNVTEDADLGMRLARFGYRCAEIDSTTFEEAPARVRAWLNQRSRWLKGWMQTWLVHMRSPTRLFGELGLRGFLVFQLIVGGNALAALIHPVFLATLFYDFMSGLQPTVLPAVIFGYFASALPGYLGLRRRAKKIGILLLTPLHWLLLSAAAWRGAYQLVSAPFHWAKTEHGLCDPGGLIDALVRLNEHIIDMTLRGEIPKLRMEATYIAASRRLNPPVAASD